MDQATQRGLAAREMSVISVTKPLLPSRFVAGDHTGLRESSIKGD